MSDAKDVPLAGAPIREWVWPLLVVVIGLFMSLLDSSIVNIAIPTIENEFGITTAGAQWVVTIYMLALGMIMPASSWLGDRYGLKRVYLYSLAVFTLGSALSGASWNLVSLSAFRVIQAFGGGLIMPIAMALVYRMVPRERIGTAMGIFGLGMILAPAIGPTLGGYLVEFVNWRLIFYVNLPVGVVGILLGLAFLPDFRGEVHTSLDWVGLGTSAAGLFALLLALSEGQTWGWGSEAIVLLFIAAVTLLAAFVYLQLTAEHPLLDLRVFGYGSFALANLLLAVVVVGMYAGVFYVPLFLQMAVGYGALQTGLLMLPAALVMGVFMPISGRLYDRYGARLPVIAGLLVLAWSTYLMGGINLVTPTGTVMGWLMLRSIGMGLAMMPIQTVSLSAIPTLKISAASAVTSVLRSVSASFGLAALTAWLQGRIAAHALNLAAGFSPGLPGSTVVAAIGRALAGNASGAAAWAYGTVEKQSFVWGIDDLFVVAALLTLVAAVLALGVRTHKHQSATPTPEPVG